MRLRPYYSSSETQRHAGSSAPTQRIAGFVAALTLSALPSIHGPLKANPNLSCGAAMTSQAYSATICDLVTPTFMVTEVFYPITVSVQNTGTATWDPGDASIRALGSDWAPAFHDIPTSVASGETVALSFSIHPKHAGTLVQQFRMHRPNPNYPASGFPFQAFGDFSQAISVTVEDPLGDVTTIPPAPILKVGEGEARDLQGFAKSELDGTYQVTNPYIPPVSSSRDNRVGLIRKANPSGKAHFVLLAPERLGALGNPPSSQHVLEVDGPAILVPDNDPGVVEIPKSDFHGAIATATHNPSISHFAICDPKIPEPNPSDCTEDDDCYSLKVITGVIFRDNLQDGVAQAPFLQLWSTPVDVKVSSPKSKDAKIVEISVDSAGQVAGPLIYGKNPGGIPDFHTPMIVGDNRLLVVRFGGTAQLPGFSGNHDAVYSHYGSQEPNDAPTPECDITRWTNFKPLASAPFDSAVKTTYDFARRPFRTPSGLDIPNGASIGARYLWMDQDANNVFFASLNRLLHRDNAGCTGGGNCLHYISCVTEGCDLANAGTGPEASKPEANAPHQGWMVMGLWTHGKAVLLDSFINHSDFGLQGEEQFHRNVRLFQDDTSTPEDESTVRVGAGREASWSEAFPYGWIDTTLQLGSTEHFFNMVPEMRTRTPQDVVWHVTAGVQTDEIPFDDYVSDRTLVFSPMNALKEIIPVQSDLGTNIFGDPYYDGNETSIFFPGMFLQNAATSLGFELPPAGKVEASNTPICGPSGDEGCGRIENVAVGGVKARGFYLQNETGIVYDIPNQDLSGEEEWVVSMFYDPREVSPSVRRLFTFPNGNYFGLHGAWNARLCVSGNCTNVRLPKEMVQKTWTHLAFHFDGTTVKFYQNGFLFASLAQPPGLVMEQGNFVIGSPDGTVKGITGWIDEFRIVAGPEGAETFSPEILCNHAAGTLVSVPHTYDSLTGNHLADLLEPFYDAEDNASCVCNMCPERSPLPGEICRYPDHLSGRESVHKALFGQSAVISDFSDHYVCNVDYTTIAGISVYDPGDPQARSLRRRLLFPEGPLLWNQPRPDSLANSFCLSCHESGGDAGLGLSALALLSSLPASHPQERRQPLQPPRLITGHLPSGYFDADSTPQVPSLGLIDGVLDPFIDNGPIYHFTFDEAGGSSFHNWVIGDVNETSNGGTLGSAIFSPGKRGYALEFDVNDSASLDHAIDLTGPDSFTSDGATADALSLSAWIRPWVDGGVSSETRCRIDALTNSPCTLIAKSGGGDGKVYWSFQIYFLANDPNPRWRGRLEVLGADDSPAILEVDLDDPTTPAVNDFNGTQWHHLAGTYGDGELAIYLGGELMASGPATDQELATSPSHGVTLGSEVDSGGAGVAYFYGRIDDLRLYDRRLSAAEIATLEASTP